MEFSAVCVQEGRGLNNSPVITTVIPTFRRPRLLERAIRSVLRQTYPNFKICVYDNASGDGTSEVVARLANEDSRVQYHCHSENIGAYANFVYGLAAVNTPYFSVLSDDDILLPECFETAFNGFDRFPDAAFSGGSTITSSDAGEVLAVPVSLWKREGYYSPPDGLLEIFGARNPTWTSIVFQKSAFDAVGGLDSDSGELADVDLVFRIAVRFPFVISKKPCGIYVSHGETYSNSVRMRTMWPGWLKVIQNVSECEEIPMDIRVKCERQLISVLKNVFFSMAIRAIVRDDFEDVYDSAALYQEKFGRDIRVIGLAAVAWVCERSSIAHDVFNAATNTYRSWLRGRKLSGLQDEYGELLQWLHE
jgi:hypothetical protein